MALPLINFSSLSRCWMADTVDAHECRCCSGISQHCTVFHQWSTAASQALHQSLRTHQQHNPSCYVVGVAHVVYLLLISAVVPSNNCRNVGNNMCNMLTYTSKCHSRQCFWSRKVFARNKITCGDSDAWRFWRLGFRTTSDCTAVLPV